MSETIVEEKMEGSLHGTARSTWPWSRDHLSVTLAKYSREDAAVLLEAFAWCVEHRIKSGDFATRIKYHPSMISKIYNGKYKSPDGAELDVPKEMIANIREFLRLEKERARGGKTEFIETQSSREIFKLCHMARESQTPAFVWGPSHCGKTWSLLEYKERFNHGSTVYVRMSPKGGSSQVIRNLAKALGISSKSNIQTVQDRIIAGITPDMLLIFDEVTTAINSAKAGPHLMATMETIRQILDECHVGAVLSGTELMLRMMKENVALEQLLTRGIHRLNLQGAPFLCDVEAIFNGSGLDWSAVHQKLNVNGQVTSPYAIISSLANSTEGRLKSLTERIRYARRRAFASEVPVSWEHFVWAHFEIVRPGLPRPSGWEPRK